MSRSLLLDHEGDANATRTRRDWLKRLIDVEEAKTQVLFSLPMIITNVLYYSIPVVSVMFAGHFGSLQLAGANLANSWASVTGFTFMTGLSGALETLCGQAFGAKMYKTLGIHLQTSCIISFFFSILVSIFWLYTEPVLILCHQDHFISQQAAVYIKCLIPGLFAYGFLQNILRFLQTQSVVKPLILFSVASMAIHIGVVCVLVQWTRIGFESAPLGASISLWVSVIILGIYVIRSEKFEHTWTGFSSEACSYILINLKLSKPSAAMVCLEYWAFEILTMLAGLMPDPEITTSLVAMCVNTDMIAYMLAYGLSAAASTRVSNELGARNPDGAKKAMFVAVKLALLLAFAVDVALFLAHDIWAGFFSDSPVIIEKFASMTPFLASSILLDSFQGVLSGVARGCGWQHLAVGINLTMFYFVGTPTGALLGFKLHLYGKGLWLGLISGLVCQATSLLLLTSCRNWTQLDLSVA